MEPVIRLPAQAIVVFNLIVIILLALGWVLAIYSFSIKRNGSRNRWKKALFVSVLFIGFGLFTLNLSGTIVPFDNAEQQKFDSQFELKQMVDDLVGPQSPK